MSDDFTPSFIFWYFYFVCPFRAALCMLLLELKKVNGTAH